jgi:ubiquitin C-terminal hydrolase
LLPARANSKTIIEDLFQGKQASRISCKSCGYSSTNEEVFLDLSIDIPVVSLPGRSRRLQKPEERQCSLEECFKSYTSPVGIFTSSFSLI